MKLPYSEPKSIGGNEISPWDLRAHPGGQAGSFSRWGHGEGIKRLGIEGSVEEPLTASAGAEVNNVFR